jgi:hypothetical protein
MTIDAQRIPAAEAWANIARANPYSRWYVDASHPAWSKSAQKRLNDPVCLPRFASSFKLDSDDQIYCIGSCFARHIETELQRQGFTVLSRPCEIDRPDTLNKYSAPSMLNEVRWALDPAVEFPEGSLIPDGAGFVDPHASFGAARPREVVLASRRAMLESARGLARAGLVFITLGLVEAWYDHAFGLYLNWAPPFAATRREPERFELRVLPYIENLKALEDIHRLIARYGRPDARIVITVSPVPFQATFTAQDVLIANTHSKSTLHAVAQDFARMHPNVDYVPSFECVTNSDRRLAWEEDRIHVTDGLVRANILSFVREYSSAPARVAAANVELAALLESLDQIDTAARPTVALPDFLTASDVQAFPAGLPRISSSSSLMPSLGPENMAAGDEVPWHAESPPSYPEWLQFDYAAPLASGALWLQCQDRFPERGPTAFALLGGDPASDRWDVLLKVERTEWRSGSQWQSWRLDPAVAAYPSYRMIFVASSDPTLLTLQRAWLQPRV